MFITASDRHYPQKTAVLLNPQSGRIRTRIAAVRRAASSLPRAIVRETGSLAELAPITDEFGSLGVDHLIIIGGDGTVQAVINHMFNSKRWPTLPLLSIVPGGTTNMTAADIGSTGSPLRCLDRLLHSLRETSRVQLVTRQVLKISQGGLIPIHGMFFGAGIIARGSELFDRKIKKTGITGESASAIVILHLLAGLFTGRQSGPWRPTWIDLDDDSGLQQRGDSIMLFASTLDRLLLGLKPYWGTGEGPIHTTRISEAPRQLWRSLLKIAFGKGDRLDLQDGYYSRNNKWLELKMDESFIVDGEFFDCSGRNGPLHISTAGPVRFLVP